MQSVQSKKRWTWLQGAVLVLFLLSSTLLPGVNVLEVGTTNGNITDIDGKYSIVVEKGKTLQFSFIGFVTQDIKVDRNVIDVVLADDTQALEEVVVVGYGRYAAQGCDQLHH